MENKGNTTQPLVELSLLSSNSKALVGSDIDEEVTSETGGYRPSICKKLVTINILIGSYCVPLLLTSTLSTYVNSQVTTLEKQFGLSSSQTGLLMAANDIGFAVVAIFIGYFAPRVHIPRSLGATSMIFGFAGVLCSLPHFLYGVVNVEDVQAFNISLSEKNMIGQMCTQTIQSDSCDADERRLNAPRTHATSALIIIGISMALQGAVKAPRHPFYITYIDDNVVRTKTGYYLGILINVAIMGPVVAFGLGGLFTKLYVTLEVTSLHPRHPKWIGAWWLGFIVFGIASILSSLPLFFFPRKMIGAPKPPDKTDTQMVKGNKNTLKLINEIKNYFCLLVKILINPIYLPLLASNITLVFSDAGMHSFLPKYIENQFGLEAWKVNLIMGLGLATASVGIFVGGWLSKCYKMGALLGLKWSCVLQFLTVIFMGLAFVFGCDQRGIMNTPSSEDASCFGNCSCSSTDYFPICGSDNTTYFSPCHAGCRGFESGTYSNCTCISDGEATAGWCYYNCPRLIPYFITMVLALFASTLSAIPRITAEIRCVTEEEKPLAMGLMTFSRSTLGWMLSPIVFGRIIDTSCHIWDSKCGQRGACVLYDLADFRVKLHGLLLGGRAATFLFIFLALLVALKTKENNTRQDNTTVTGALI